MMVTAQGLPGRGLFLQMSGGLAGMTDYFLFIAPQTHIPNLKGKEGKNRQQDVFISIDLTPLPLSSLTISL